MSALSRIHGVSYSIFFSEVEARMIMMIDTIRRFHAAHPAMEEIQGTMNKRTLATMRTH